MNIKKSQNSQQGFTIVEVIIVLAIAGLILLIVLFAVPQMRKNSRNTQRSADVGRIAGATQEFMTESTNGGLPSPGASYTPGSDAEVILSLANAPAVYQLVVASHGSTATQTPAVSEVILVPQTKCDSTSGDSSTPLASGPGSKNIAIIFGVEGGSNSTLAKCIDL